MAITLTHNSPDSKPNKTALTAQQCPLCGQNNQCANLANTDLASPCWCANRDLDFSQELLKQVPNSRAANACICQQCVLNAMDCADQSK